MSSTPPDFLVHDTGDAVGVVVVEGITAGQRLEGWVMDSDQTLTMAVNEAIPLGHAHGSQLLAAIAIHKFPVSIVLFSMLLHNGNADRRAYICLLIFGLVAPIGAAIGSLPALEPFTPKLLAVVIGIFMHVSTTILFESSEDHHYNLQKGAAIALGAGIAALGVLLPLHSHTH